MTVSMTTSADAALEAAKALFKAAGYDDAAVQRALLALEGPVEDSPMMDRLMSAKEVCDWLGISATSLWRLRIPHVKLGGLRRYIKRDVEEFLRGKRSQSSEK